MSDYEFTEQDRIDYRAGRPVRIGDAISGPPARFSFGPGSFPSGRVEGHADGTTWIVPDFTVRPPQNTVASSGRISLDGIRWGGSASGEIA